MTVDQAHFIIGNRPTWELKNIVTALSFHPWGNSPEERERLTAAKIVLAVRRKSHSRR